jgi:phosphopantothenoylcysteine decarboxylase/phosphopantothenate--cysteine ligase
VRPVVVLGVTGGIAAYKAVHLARLLVDAGIHVVPVLTRDATRFVGPATFSALCSEPARTDLFDDPDPVPHVALGRRAALVVVAPATAHFLGSFASGLAGDLLGATLLATRAPVVVCPAMHTEMWEHEAVRANVARLRARGVIVVEPDVGRLAGGDEGAGRLAAPERIAEVVLEQLGRRGRVEEGRDEVGAEFSGFALGRHGPSRTTLGSGGATSKRDRVAADLVGVRVLVTAGGTREPIDAVRVITNRSSGRQGHAIAEVARARGASVVLVTTSSLKPPEVDELVRVETAEVVMAAAVADFRPKRAVAGKLRRGDGVPELVLEPTPDVLAELGRTKRPDQVLVGFAAEYGAGLDQAAAKLASKRADLLVANDVSAPGAGFDVETNAVTILGADGSRRVVPLSSKAHVANCVLDAVVALLVARGGRGRSRHEGSDATQASPSAVAGDSEQDLESKEGRWRAG